MASRHTHFKRECNVCKKVIYGTKNSQRLHKENCREKRAQLPEWGQKLGARVKAIS